MPERRGSRCLPQQQRLQVLGSTRLTEQLALGVVTRMSAQEMQVAERFHAFGHDLHAEAAAHLDDGLYYRRVVRILADIAYEGLIDFQCSDGELLQGREGRVAR